MQREQEKNTKKALREKKKTEFEELQKKTEFQKQVQIDQDVRLKRGRLLDKIIVNPRQSPYWGFQLACQLINVLVVLYIAAFVIGNLVLLASGLIALIKADEVGFSEIALAALTFFVYLLGSFVATFLVVAILVFCRNLIDWLIDVESHLNRLADLEQRRLPLQRE